MLQREAGSKGGHSTSVTSEGPQQLAAIQPTKSQLEQQASSMQQLASSMQQLASGMQQLQGSLAQVLAVAPHAAHASAGAAGGAVGRSAWEQGEGAAALPGTTGEVSWAGSA